MPQPMPPLARPFGSANYRVSMSDAKCLRTPWTRLATTEVLLIMVIPQVLEAMEVA